MKKKENHDTKESKEKKPNKKQIIQENRILRGIFLIIGILFIVSLIGYFTLDSIRNFEYEGVKFEVVSFCDVEPCLILYQTKLPVITSEGEKAEYNLYLRNDPRELKEIKFDGDVNILSDMVVSSDSDFNCDGDGIIAMANLVNLYGVIGTKVIKNEELSCSLDNSYTYMNILKGNETKVRQSFDSCYVLEINNCEILEGTERVMLETLVEVNKMIKNGP